MSETMVRVKHRRRRKGLQGDGGRIIVGSTHYFLDENGEVVVTSEHAGWMLQGRDWIRLAVPKQPAPAPAPAAPSEGKPSEDKPLEPKLEELDKDALIRRAEDLGVSIDKRWSPAKIVEVINKAKEGE